MATESQDDAGDIVVDDKPREDGLSSERDEAMEPARDAGSSCELEPLVSEIPRILERLDELAVWRSESESKNSENEDRVSEALNELTNRLGALAHQQSESGRAFEGRVVKSYNDVAKSYNAVKKRLDELIQRVGGLEERLDDYPSQRSAEPIDNSKRSSHEAVDSSAATEAAITELVNTQFTPLGEEQHFEQLIFGKELCEDRSLAIRRRELLDGVSAREATAIGLAARLMLVRSASAEELPTLLKEIGEAYYRRYPKSADVTDALETLLVEDLDRCIAAVGLRNSIELIRPGDRYDATRHVSFDRGVEVAEVRGWAVLRDNGKPLTKASVGLR